MSMMKFVLRDGGTGANNMSWMLFHNMAGAGPVSNIIQSPKHFQFRTKAAPLLTCTLALLPNIPNKGGLAFLNTE